MIFARCPACQTVFRVRPEQLRARHGEVRCGQCLTAFNALDHLVEGASPLPPAAPSPADAPASPTPPADAPAAPAREPSPRPARSRSETVFVLEEKPSAGTATGEAAPLPSADQEPAAAVPEGTPPPAPPRPPHSEEAAESRWATQDPPRSVTPADEPARHGPARDELARPQPSADARPSAQPGLREPGAAGEDFPERAFSEGGFSATSDEPAPEERRVGESDSDERASAPPGHKASTFESLAERLEFEIPETFLTQPPPSPALDSDRMNHVRYRQRKTEWPEIPRPAASAFPEFVAPAAARSRSDAADERAADRAAPASRDGVASAESSGTPRATPGGTAREAGAGGVARGFRHPQAEPGDIGVPVASPVSPEAVDAALREAAAETQDEARHVAPVEPRIGRSAPPPEPDDFLDSDRLDERYGRVRKPPRSRALWGVGFGILMGILAVQAAYLFRDDITRTWPQLRPAFVLACEHLGCTLELPRVAAAIEIETSDLLSDPKRAGSFTLNAVVRNNAPHPQAYPYLELTLTDARDRPVIRRALSPQEWVPADKLERGFLAGEEISVRLPFEAPDVEAVGYRIYAFYP